MSERCQQLGSQRQRNYLLNTSTVKPFVTRDDVLCGARNIVPGKQSVEGNVATAGGGIAVLTRFIDASTSIDFVAQLHVSTLHEMVLGGGGRWGVGGGGGRWEKSGVVRVGGWVGRWWWWW